MLAELTQLRAGMADCLDAPAWALPDTDLINSLDAVHQLEQAVAAVKLHLVREVDARALPVAAHAYSTAGWLRERLRVNAG
ncbi:MAG TPA: HNH endonuclease, partial [Catenuloplanes sp.]